MLKEKKVQTRRNMFRKEVEYVEPPLKNSKALKQNAKENLIVTVNGILYDGDTVSINYMSAVVAVANAKYNKALADGMSSLDAYNNVYKQTIGWKNADNKVSQVQIESVVEALELAMGKVANIVGA